MGAAGRERAVAKFAMRRWRAGRWRFIARASKSCTQQEGNEAMRSMTGFGRTQLERGGTQVVAEVRALNQRFFELKLNLPRGWGEHEAEIKKIVQGAVERGRVEAFVRCVVAETAAARLRVNDDLAANYVTELRRLGKRLGLDGKLGLDAILQRPEIFQVIEEENDTRTGVEVALLAMKRAVKALDLERRREGAALRRDFETRIKKIAAAHPADREARRAIAHHNPRQFRNARARVARRFAGQRKAALRRSLKCRAARRYHRRADAARVHLTAMRALINRAGPIGKSIEFLLQEINREVNTMGAKSQNAALSQITIEMKGEVEKMREQVQNVE